MTDFNFADFDTVFCDSEEALYWARKNKLNKKSIIKTASPYLLLKNKKYFSYDKNWNLKKLKLFSDTINAASKLIFEDGGFSQYSMNYHRLVLDGLSIGEIYYKNEGKLFIDIINEDGDEEIKEINAKNGIIFKQYPESPKKIKIGRKIDMWVVRDSLAIK